VIDFVYGTMNSTGDSATIGLQKGTGSQVNQFECNTGGISTGMGITYTPTGCGTPSATPTFTPTATATATNTPTATPTGTQPNIHFSSTMYEEDESQTALIEVDRTGDTSGTNSVLFSTSNGTATGGAACTTDVDYISVTNLTVTFNPGETQKFVPVIICPDGITEADQTVMLAITGPNIGTPSTATLVINDTATAYRNPTGIVINGNAAATPYPAQITVSNGPQQIGSMRVTLYDLVANNPDNVDVMLVAPGGQAFILMANSGGTGPNASVTLNFRDTAGQVLPDNGPLTTDDFEPTSYGSVQAFPPPAPASFNLPGSAIGGTGTQTLLGNYGGTNANGVWSLFVRDDTITGDPNVVVGNIAGGWGLEFVGTTAAQASISGRVLTSDGRPIRNADVVITGNALEHPITVTTGSLGWYSFDGLRSGETYVVTVNSRRFTFSTPSRVITLVDNVADADFIADPQ
jgi:hypothetical protein